MFFHHALVILECIDSKELYCHHNQFRVCSRCIEIYPQSICNRSHQNHRCSRGAHRTRATCQCIAPPWLNMLKHRYDIDKEIDQGTDLQSTNSKYLNSKYIDRQILFMQTLCNWILPVYNFMLQRHINYIYNFMLQGTVYWPIL